MKVKMKQITFHFNNENETTLLHFHFSLYRENEST